jgi:hypothetical protein
VLLTLIPILSSIGLELISPIFESIGLDSLSHYPVTLVTFVLDYLVFYCILVLFVTDYYYSAASVGFPLLNSYHKWYQSQPLGS